MVLILIRIEKCFKQATTHFHAVMVSVDVGAFNYECIMCVCVRAWKGVTREQRICNSIVENSQPNNRQCIIILVVNGFSITWKLRCVCVYESKSPCSQMNEFLSQRFTKCSHACGFGFICKPTPNYTASTFVFFLFEHVIFYCLISFQTQQNISKNLCRKHNIYIFQKALTCTFYFFENF